MAPISEQEKALMSRIQKGEEKAWEDFIELYGRLIYYAIQRTLELKGVRLPADTIQEIFHSLFVHLAENRAKRLLSYTGKRNCSLATWIRMISINYTIDIIRRQAKFSFQVEFEEIREGEFEKSWVEGIKSPEELAEEKEKEEKLKRALEELTREDKNFIKLYLSGISPQEMARIYKTTISNIYSRHALVKEKLKKSIGYK